MRYYRTLPRILGTLILVLGLVSFASSARAGSIFLTGHDTDFHAAAGSNRDGALRFNRVAIDYITDPLFNAFRSSGVDRLLYVESSLTLADVSDPGNHTELGQEAIETSLAGSGLTLEKHDASTLADALDRLGTDYAGIIVASDVGGLLSQDELDILNDRFDDVLGFLNAGGGLYAMAESNFGSGLTPDGNHFGFVPFVVSTPFDQSGAGHVLTSFGESLGLTESDIRPDFTHNVFLDDFGLNVVNVDADGRILTLASRSRLGRDGVIPVPTTLLLFGAGAVALLAARRRG